MKSYNLLVQRSNFDESDKIWIRIPVWINLLLSIFLSIWNSFICFSCVNGFWCYSKKLFWILQLTFVKDARKTAQANLVTRKHITMNCFNYIYHFQIPVFHSALSAVHLHMGMLTVMMCQRRYQLQKTNTFTFDTKKNMLKKEQEVVRSNKVAFLRSEYNLKNNRVQQMCFFVLF